MIGWPHLQEFNNTKGWWNSMEKNNPQCVQLSDLREEYREKLIQRWTELLVETVDIRRELDRVERRI